ncbi:HD domain-containing protein [Halobacillus sp. H74]|uniref:HD domain-containing protein n=1 Tax=Halobacillus sp. H74 TaxID=3457436 RepID=UPI003FCE1C17
MNKIIVRDEIRKFVKNKFRKDSTGHDFEHMARVARWSDRIAEDEGADRFLCEVAGWLHDVGDPKLFVNPETALEERTQLLKGLLFNDENIDHINGAIETVSFSKGKKPMTLMGKIVQDADRLDAIGAVGIARTFAYGGARDQPVYNPDDKKGHSIGHFEEKLLKLCELMNTDSGKLEAEHRHAFMVEFLKEFNREQNTKYSIEENGYD